MYSASYMWVKIIHRLEEQFGTVAISALMDDAEVLSVSDQQLILYSPTDFRQEAIRRTWKKYIEEAVEELFQIKLELIVWGDYERDRHLKPVREQTWICNPQFNFENFIAGSCNLIPLKAAMVVAENPGNEVYNPLYLYGPPGVGKTHLLYAIANSLSQSRPEMKIVYVKGDHFTNELVQAIMNSSTHEFKKKYREADILLVDDIQFIAGKEATQEEFFHTFNDLFEYHKQIVLVSDRTPNDMPTLEERLKGRFGEGVMVPIVSPDSETRKSIIKDKAHKLGLSLNEECVNYASDHLRDSVRQIEGGLKKIRAYRDLSGMELTLENIAKTIDDLHTSEKTAAITPDLVVRYVCKYYGIEETQLKSQLRSRNVALPRQIAMYMIRHLTKMSFPNMGKYFDKDQATVQHAVRKIETELRNKNSQLKSIIQDIQMAIDGSV